jgi:hypothetical protein
VASSRSGITDTKEHSLFPEENNQKAKNKKYIYTVMTAITYVAVLCDFLGCRCTLGGKNKKLN